jgi:hypothetical protein
MIIFLIGYIWWPLAKEVLSFIDWQGPWWLYMDWLLVGVFLFMSFTIMIQADLRVDGLIILVGTIGGLVIESWGTQTNLWFYYTAERPPLWIIPAWPIASLSIDRLERLLNHSINKLQCQKVKDGCHPLFFSISYWIVFSTFFILMLIFIAPTFSKITTILATLLVFLLIVTPTDKRKALFTFIAGSALGYFLERWGTTRQCWTYYTYATPPVFAVLAHGMAAVSFWRSGLLFKKVWNNLQKKFHGKQNWE